MPGNSWKNLRHHAGTGSGSSAGAGPGNTDSARSGADRSSLSSNPQIDLLLRQRQELEDNLRNLVNGSTSDQREAARFHVPTFAQRQAEQRRWENQREQLRAQKYPSPSPQLFQGVPSEEEKMRTGLRNFQQPVNEWMDERDQSRNRLNARFKRADRRLRTVARPLKKLSDQVGSATRQLRNLDKTLAEEGLNSEREELRKLGTDKIHKADRTLEKINSAIDTPGRAVEKIDAFWRKRDNEISGSMDRFGSYSDNAKRKLSLDKGGSGDLFERMQRNRERALERRREQRREQLQDQQRRDRALRRKKEKEEI